MDEQLLNKRLRRGITICSLVGVLILVAGIQIMNLLNRSLKSIVYNQMKNVAEEYKRRILRQVDKDFQTLQTVSAFFIYEDIPGSVSFSSSLYEANQRNDFVTMAYFNKDGIGVLAHKDYGTRSNTDYRTLSEEVQAALDASYAGEPAISYLFESTVTNKRIYVCSVPVYFGTELTGVLSASNHMEVFADILEGDNVLGGSGSIHLVNAQGQHLLTSEEDMFGTADTFFEAAYFDEENLEQIHQAVEAQSGAFVTMNYGNKPYQVYLNPIGINDWYIMCVNETEAANRTAYRMVHIMAMTFVLLLGVILFLLVYICRQIAGNNHRLTLLAYQDRLTGADNLLRFTQRLGTARKTEKRFCLVALNVHQFKFINEIFGAKAADRILCQICACIREMIRENEFFCRESSDIFYLYLKEDDQEEIEKRMKALIGQICGKTMTGQTDYQIQMYAGVFIQREEDTESLSTEMLITRTRFAMQNARALPANQVYFYDYELHKNEELENYVESHMQQALEKGEFHLYLQPKVNLLDGKLAGAEALVRWIMEDGSMIYPNTFIPQFERNGFCVRLDMYMAEQAFRLIRGWIDEGLTPIPVSVNQSKLLFFDAGYLDNMKALLDKYQIPPGLITLEILEGLALEHAEEINAKIRRLREMGFLISMDDFGSGYASFNTLGNLEIDELKLDRSLLLESSGEEGGRFRQIMESIIDLTKRLKISTVAEGVETEENEELLRSLGCDLGQGYLYSRPISAEEFSKKYIRQEVETCQ